MLSRRLKCVSYKICCKSLASTIPSTMSSSTLHQLLLISILPSIIGITHAYTQCRDDQKTLLLGFKNELKFNSSFSRKLAHWNQTVDCCSWGGVECDGVGRVISLQLDDEAISGGIENSSTLFSLRHLKKLNLAYNFYYISQSIQIPSGIHNLTYLTHLNLSNAGFGGQVPVELSYLRRLVSLDISSRNRGFPPLKAEHPNLKKLLQNLTGLTELYLDNVVISAQENHWCQTISSYLPDLRVLSLRGCDLSGPFHPSLSRIHSLSVLHLDGNNLSTPVPDFFANFSRLTSLSLSECSLQGTFPEAIFQIPTLQNLDLSYNVLLSGTVPQFPHRGSLRSVVLRYTNFSGSLPYSITNLGMLSHMDLSNCNLNGSLSSIHFEHLSRLVYVDLGYNSLSGSIPESLFGLPSLQNLKLNNNQFKGTLQMENIQKLHNLTELDLSYNKLSVDASFSKFPLLNLLGLASCNLQSFPDLKNQYKLSSLDLSSNRIAGEIPSWIWGIGNQTLSRLNLSSNLLVDLQKPYNIPTSLELLDLHSNQLRGEFPQPRDGNSFYYLSFFSVANNSLTGAIPTSLCSFALLQVLDLSVNKLSGSIPPCLLENIENLSVFNLERNNISGEIPDRFSVNCGLMTLDLNNNNLERKIPISLGNCKLLQVMNVGNNKMNDSFPCMLPRSLLILVLRSNRFHGEIRCDGSWPDLQIMDISHNNFSGDLQPVRFSSWRGMMVDDDDAMVRRNRSSFSLLKPTSYDYRNEVTLTIKGLELKLVRIWPQFASMDFSCNNFQGEIPNAIGDLTSVYLLNLSHNSMAGAIPKSLGKLRQLGSMDLSVNQLEGEIPKELAQLTFLSVLNLSHNKLVGKIPVGPQIQTFSADSFAGNEGLCGLPLNISCRDTDVSPPKLGNVKSQEKREIEWEYVFAALGYGVGLGSIIWVFLCCRSFRVRYFEKVEDVFDRISDRRRHMKRSRRGRRLARQQR